jgi:pimeloyl-ACP methyl ester carboxylesterase
VVPVTHGHVYQAEVGEAGFTVLPSSGHLPHVEQPEALANAVLEYLERR